VYGVLKLPGHRTLWFATRRIRRETQRPREGNGGCGAIMSPSDVPVFR
jgi:hypothetical protein